VAHDRDALPSSGSPAPSGPRWLTCLGLSVVLVVAALALGYVALVAAFGVRSGRGWIDSTRRTVTVRTRPALADNAFDTYVAAVAALEKAEAAMSSPVTPRRPVDPEGPAATQWDEALDEYREAGKRPAMVERFVAASDGALGLIHTAAGERYVPPDRFTTRPPREMSRFRGLASLAAARVKLLRTLGSGREALEVARDGLALGASIPAHGMVHDYSTACRCVAIVHYESAKVVRTGRLTPDQLLAHARYVRGLRERLWPMGDAIRAELPLARAWSEEARTGYAETYDDSPWSDRLRARIRLRLWSPDQSLPWIEDRLARLAEAADKPDGGRALTRLVEMTERDIRMRNDWFAELAIPVLPDKYTYFAAVKAHLGLEEIICYLEAYRRQVGSYPRTLGALVPRYADSLPDDPFAGAPFRYEVKAGSHKLWSPKLAGFEAKRGAGVRPPIPPP